MNESMDAILAQRFADLGGERTCDPVDAEFHVVHEARLAGMEPMQYPQNNDEVMKEL